MKRRRALDISLGTVSLVLATASSTLRAGIVSPDGKLVAYTIPAYDKDANLANDVCLRASDGATARALGRVFGAWDQVSWIGNDRIVLSEFAQSGSCLILNTSGKRLPDIVLPSECEPLYLAVSPDGEKVAFTGSRGTGDNQDYGLFVFEPRTGAVKLLIKKALKTLAAWSPDSRKLVIGTGAGYAKNYPLQIVDTTTGEVDNTGALGVGASWSPDGKLIACTTEVQAGGSWSAGVPTDGKLGIYNVEQRKMQVVEGTDGALNPAWSGSGAYVAYLAGEKIEILRRNGDKKAIAHQLKGRDAFHVQIGWAGDEALYIRTRTYLARLDFPAARLVTVAKWDEPKAPALKPKEFRTVELPRVTVTYARFDKQYAEAFGGILEEALEAYESHGFSMPPKATLEAQIDPAQTRLWTDGESHMFLHLKSKELLAPASRTGVFNIYGMCHELGHIAMYRNLESLMGLPPGVGEGWAHYAGSVIVTEVAEKLGRSIWPEYYNVADVEGIGRLKRQAAEAKLWDKLDATSRAALVFYRIETEYGRDKLAAAMNAALAERPTGKALMPLLLARLRTVTSNPAAADWVPASVLVPRVDWQTHERNPGDDFFAQQKVEKDGAGRWLLYDNGAMSAKRSMAGSAQTMLFRLPEGSWQLDGIRLFCARYGTDDPPKEAISIYLCDESFNLLRELKIPYASFAKGKEKWQTASFSPVEAPRTFYLGVDFHATAQKGVYVGIDKSVKRSHSRIAMPYAQVSDMETTADWMLRAHIVPKR